MLRLAEGVGSHVSRGQNTADAVKDIQSAEHDLKYTAKLATDHYDDEYVRNVYWDSTLQMYGPIVRASEPRLTDRQ